MAGDLDALIHQPVRLRIMATLYADRRVRYVLLPDALGLTSGNLTAPMKKLVGAGYVRANDSLATGVFELVYTITPAGSEASRRYLERLKELLSNLGAK